MQPPGCLPLGGQMQLVHVSHNCASAAAQQQSCVHEQHGRTPKTTALPRHARPAVLLRAVVLRCTCSAGSAITPCTSAAICLLAWGMLARWACRDGGLGSSRAGSTQPAARPDSGAAHMRSATCKCAGQVWLDVQAQMAQEVTCSAVRLP